MTQEEIVEKILHELVLAKQKHHWFPKDAIHQASIMMEEAGEAVQVANDLYLAQTQDEIKALKECFIKELCHTAAMCIRTMENM